MRFLVISIVVALGVGVGCGRSTTPPPAASGQPTSSTAPVTASGADPAPADSDEYVLSKEAAGKLGARAFRVRGLSGGGWTRTEDRDPILMQLSGPPGGPLQFQVRVYSDASAPIEKLFKDAVTPMAPLKVGPAEKVRIAGADHDAQSFRTGTSLATANWCAIKLPPSAGASKGLLVLAEVGTNETTEPKCEISLRHAPIKPLVESLAFE
jgi:hypothetical protein